ncbi:MAG: carbamoyltransferase HypF [Acidilobaceae archaeon]
MGREAGGSKAVGEKARALKITVVGVVQGVGFRPFIYRLASSLSLGGYVRNLGGSEVEIWVEGRAELLEAFLERLVREKPPPARIEYVRVEPVEPVGYRSFEISGSERSRRSRSMIPPDIAICNDCVREILEPGTRFSSYYWNSCAWCGPRFSMIYELPYDRENTAMRVFSLCEDCSRDYSDPANTRRFHAQGISCSVCGPRTYVYTSRGERVDVEDPAVFAARVIEEGAIVAVKSAGGYHIACLATRDEVVVELRRRKKRPFKPFALMARDLSVVREIAELSDTAEKLLVSPERPIVLLPKKRSSKISEHVAPGLSTIGVMLPYTGFQVLLLSHVRDGVLVMTSANIHGKPMCTNLECVLRELENVVDYVVEHERAIAHRVDDSVVRFTDGEPVLLRRGRGYAPAWVTIPFNLPDSAAVGAELQSAGAVGFEDKVVLTQYIGDVDEPATLEDLERELSWFIKAYDLMPKLIALDMHPLYHSREVAVKLADSMGAELVEVQHHHAHAAAVMTELGVKPGERILAIAIDGTGYGLDGGIWGGEVLVAGYDGFERVGSMKPYSLPGGDTAALYPAKPLIALLASHGYSEEEVVEILRKRELDSTLPRGLKEALVAYDLAKRGRGVVSTSLGRVLDAFSALLGVCYFRSYEGEPAMRLEAVADEGRDLGWEAGTRWLDGRLVVDTRSLLELSIDSEASREDKARSILTALGRALARVALDAVKGRRGVRGDAIVVCGGAAVNTHIVRGMREVAREEGVRVLLPKLVPPNDGSIALGQLVVACFTAGLC